MTIDCLDPAIGAGDEEFRMYELFDSKDNPIFGTDPDSSTKADQKGSYPILLN